MREAFGRVSATGKKTRSPNHKLLFQLRLSQQPGKTAPGIIFPRRLLEVGRNAKVVVEHDAKDVCFLFSSARQLHKLFCTALMWQRETSFKFFFEFELFNQKKKKCLKRQV